RAARPRPPRSSDPDRRGPGARAGADGGVRPPRRRRALRLLRARGGDRPGHLQAGPRGLPGALAGRRAVSMLRPIAVAAAVALAFAPAAAAGARPGRENLVRIWPIHYRAHDGFERRAYVVLPRWYGPHDHPPIPLIISPHGRGVPAIDNVRIWGNLPA